jgi:hypothetical protein
MKRNRSEKNAFIFASKRNEAKQKRKNAFIFASKRNGSKIFSLRCEKRVYFRLFSHLKRNENENKRKQSEKRLFRFALKRNEKIGSEMKRNEKNFGSETKRKYALLISL